MGKPDWFKIYPAKLLQDSLVESMTTEELGCAFRLLCRQWADGFIPDDLDKLGRLCRVDGSRMGDLWVTLSEWFPIIEPGKRANRFMFVERDLVLDKMNSKSEKGRESANKRWDQIRKKKDGLPMPDQLGDPMQEKRVKTREKRPPKISQLQTVPEELVPVIEFLTTNWPAESWGKGNEKRSVRAYVPADLWNRVAGLAEKFDKIPGAVLFCGVPYLRRLLKDAEDSGKVRFAKDMSNFWGIKDGNRFWEETYNQGLIDYQKFMEKAGANEGTK